MSTTITIQIDETPRVPIRRHVHIPSNDQAVQDWFDAQKDQSASVRMLIHDDIAQHGIGDRIHRAKFGTNPRVVVKGTGSVTPAAPAPLAPAAAPAAAQPAAQPAGPVPWGVPMADPRDAEIARLRAEIDRLESAMGPFGPFLSDLANGNVLI